MSVCLYLLMIMLYMYTHTHSCRSNIYDYRTYNLSRPSRNIWQAEYYIQLHSLWTGGQHHMAAKRRTTVWIYWELPPQEPYYTHGSPYWLEWVKYLMSRRLKGACIDNTNSLLWVSWRLTMAIMIRVCLSTASFSVKFLSSLHEWTNLHAARQM